MVSARVRDCITDSHVDAFGVAVALADADAVWKRRPHVVAVSILKRSEHAVAGAVIQPGFYRLAVCVAGQLQHAIVACFCRFNCYGKHNAIVFLWRDAQRNQCINRNRHRVSHQVAYADRDLVHHRCAFIQHVPQPIGVEITLSLCVSLVHGVSAKPGV